MTFALRRITKAVGRLGIVRAVYMYGVRRVGRRFTRFAFGSAMALAASEITLLACLGIAHIWPTVSAAIAWFAGAATSYLLSRWAWERRGRPHLLKETLPFWLIAVGTIVVLSSATSLAHHFALSHGLRPIPRLAFVGSAYLVANAVTFMSRFMIFHYILFADRGSKDSPRPSTEAPAVAEASGTAAGDAFTKPPAGDRFRKASAEDGFREAPAAW